MERNDLLIGGKLGGYSATVGGLRDLGSRQARQVVAGGGATQGQFNAAQRLGFRRAAARRAGRRVDLGAGERRTLGLT